MNPELYLRKAVPSDVDILYRWVNEQSVRTQAFHSEYITYEEHVRWFHALLADKNQFQYLLVERQAGQKKTDQKEPDHKKTDHKKTDQNKTDQRESDQKKTDQKEPDHKKTDQEQLAGQVRISCHNDQAFIDYSIDVSRRRLGYGQAVIALIQQKVHEEFAHIRRLTARVKPGNAASACCFEKNGFSEIYRQYEFCMEDYIPGKQTPGRDDPEEGNFTPVSDSR